MVLGAGGHGRALLELLRDHGGYSVVGIVDRAPPERRLLLGTPVLGDEALLPGLRAGGVRAACVAIGDNADRLAAGARLRALGFALPVLAHPAALRAASASVAEGAVLLPRVVLGALTRVGALAIVNTGAIVEHDGVVGEGAHVGPGAVLAGGVTVGARALLGAGVSCRPGVSIGDDAVVATGAAVACDIPAGERWGGVPARRLA